MYRFCYLRDVLDTDANCDQQQFWPSVARVSEQLDSRCSQADIPPPKSAMLDLYSVARKFISHPA